MLGNYDKSMGEYMKSRISLLLVICLSGFLALSCEILRTDEMVATRGEVCFNVQPAASDVYIDGGYAGTAQGCKSLERGPHTLRIEKRNFVTYERDIYVGEARQMIEVKLTPERGKAEKKITPGKAESKTPPGREKSKEPPGRDKDKSPPGKEKARGKKGDKDSDK
jgi:hypothetical protein